KVLDHGPIDPLCAFTIMTAAWRNPTMSGLDIFAWIVLIVLVVTTVTVLVFLAMLPGIIARSRRHPWAQAVSVAGWVTLIFAFPRWPLAVIWAFVDVPTAPAGRGEAAQ